MHLRLSESELRLPKLFSQLMAGYLSSQWITFLTVVLMIVPAVSQATTVNFTANNLGSSRWEYAYTVTNDTLAASIDEFTIYFDEGLYANLSIDSARADWDGLTVEPESILGAPTAGYYDVVALVSGITVSAAEGGFQVSFDWLGAGIPGAQSFDIVNPGDFTVLDSRVTTLSPISSLPEPSTTMLLVAGLVALAPTRKCFNKHLRR